MGFIYSGLRLFVLITNALVVLNNRFLLEPYNIIDMDEQENIVLKRIASFLKRARMIFSIPLIFLNVFIIICELLFG